MNWHSSVRNTALVKFVYVQKFYKMFIFFTTMTSIDTCKSTLNYSIDKVHRVVIFAIAQLSCSSSHFIDVIDLIALQPKAVCRILFSTAKTSANMRIKEQQTRETIAFIQLIYKILKTGGEGGRQKQEKFLQLPPTNTVPPTYWGHMTFLPLPQLRPNNKICC